MTVALTYSLLLSKVQRLKFSLHISQKDSSVLIAMTPFWLKATFIVIKNIPLVRKKSCQPVDNDDRND